MTHERRSESRQLTNGEGSLTGKDEVRCRVANLSQSGALAVCDRALNEMDMVNIRVQVELEGGELDTFQCEAAVVRCTRRSDGEYDLGLFFTAIEPEQKRILDHVLSSGRLVPAI